MENKYFIAPIGHPIIILNGNRLMMGIFGLFTRIGNAIYHASQLFVQEDGTIVRIPIIGMSRESLEKIRQEYYLDETCIQPFHKRLKGEKDSILYQASEITLPRS
jgi:hypothetical protein